MRFANVNGQKIGVISIVIENLHDVADLATEWRSSEAAKDDNQGFRSGAFANVKSFGAIERVDARIRSAVADFQTSSMHVRQRVAHHVQCVLWTAAQH